MRCCIVKSIILHVAGLWIIADTAVNCIRLGDEDEDDDSDEEDMDAEGSPSTSSGASDKTAAKESVATPEQEEPALGSSSPNLQSPVDSPVHSKAEMSGLTSSLTEVVKDAPKEHCSKNVVLEPEAEKAIPEGGKSTTSDVMPTLQEPDADRTTELVEDGPLLFEKFQSAKDMEVSQVFVLMFVHPQLSLFFYFCLTIHSKYAFQYRRKL